MTEGLTDGQTFMYTETRHRSDTYLARQLSRSARSSDFAQEFTGFLMTTLKLTTIRQSAKSKTLEEFKKFQLRDAHANESSIARTVL